MDKKTLQRLIEFWKHHAYADILCGVTLIFMACSIFALSILLKRFNARVLISLVLGVVFGAFFIKWGNERLEAVK